MEFILFIGFIILLVLIINLRNRVTHIEQSLQGKHIPQQAPTIQSGYTEPTQGPAVGIPQPPYTQPVYAPLPNKGPDPLVLFGRWIKEDWLLKLGGFLLLIAFGWLTTYAFLNNWIGPAGRIGFGILAGIALLTLGWWRIKKYIHQGEIFLVLGSTTILLTVFAGRNLYDFFTPITALGIMFLGTAFVALMSVKYNSRTLSLASITLAGIAPFLTGGSSSDYVLLFSYLLVVVLGAIWIVFLTGQRSLTIDALTLVVIYSILNFPGADKGIILLFVYLFAGIFFIANTAGIIHAKGKSITADLITAFANGIFLLAWIIAAAPSEWQTLIIIAWMIAFLLGAFAIFRITQRRTAFYIYSGVGIVMLATATATQLDGAALIIAYSFESALIPFLTYILLKDYTLSVRTCLLLFVPGILSLSSMMSPKWQNGVLHEDFFVLFVLMAIFFFLGLFFFEHKNENAGEQSNVSVALLIVGSVYTYILIWLSLGAILEKDIAVMSSLIIYTIVGLVAYFYGKTRDIKVLKYYAGFLLGFVVARLLIVEVWNMEISGRIITFFAIGALLVSTAFFSKSKKSAPVITTNTPQQ